MTSIISNIHLSENIYICCESYLLIIGYGFVDFEKASDAETAAIALSSTGIQAQMAKQQEQDPTNLYIANLPTYVDENYLESMVRPFGNVISVRILRDPGECGCIKQHVLV